MGGDYNRRLGWNWLWFLPLCVAVLIFVEGHTVPYAWQLAKLARKRWTWGVFFSPSAYFCMGVISVSIAWPLMGLALVSNSVTSIKAVKPPGRYIRVFVILFLIFMLPVITDALLWGSFPFTFDRNGIARLRMIPFIPWPSGNFGEY
jgi:hypothetical protein